MLPKLPSVATSSVYVTASATGFQLNVGCSGRPTAPSAGATSTAAAGEALKTLNDAYASCVIGSEDWPCTCKVELPGAAAAVLIVSVEVPGGVTGLAEKLAV